MGDGGGLGYGLGPVCTLRSGSCLLLVDVLIKIDCKICFESKVVDFCCIYIIYLFRVY